MLGGVLRVVTKDSFYLCPCPGSLMCPCHVASISREVLGNVIVKLRKTFRSSTRNEYSTNDRIQSPAVLSQSHRMSKGIELSARQKGSEGNSDNLVVYWFSGIILGFRKESCQSIHRSIQMKIDEQNHRGGKLCWCC